jgi:hypothetical protein
VPGFLLADDAVSARKQQFDSWVDEQRRNAEQAAQQVQQATQAAAQQQASEAAARAEQFQSWVSQQQALQPPPVEPAPAPPAAPPAPAVAPPPQPAAPLTPEAQDRARQFQDWVTQQTQQATQPGPPAEQTPAAAPTAAPSTAVMPGQVTAGAPEVSQFGDSQLTADEAYAACGPAAAVRFAQRFGRNPTLREAVDLAKTVGWSTSQGMAGLSSEKQLMDKMGVPTKLVNGADWGTFANEARTGNPVTISTSGHYFTADNWNPQTNQFHVGRSGLDLKGGKEWMTPEEMTALMGEVQGGLLADNPTVPSSTIGALPPSRFNPTGQTTAGMSGGGPRAGQMGDQGAQILGGAADAASWLGSDAQKALQSILVTEGGLAGARGDSGRSAGPLQFFEGGQLGNFARAFQMTLEDAKTYVEQHPLEAIRWAIGVPSNPGYLGAALLQGLQRNLSGPALATYAQEHGQVSDSPERAGDNYRNLFGQGQEIIRAGTGAVEGALDAGRQVATRAGDLVTQGQQLVEQGAQGARDAWSQFDQMQAQTRANSDRWLADQRARMDAQAADRQQSGLEFTRTLDEQMRQFRENAEPINRPPLAGFTAPGGPLEQAGTAFSQMMTQQPPDYRSEFEAQAPPEVRQQQLEQSTDITRAGRARGATDGPRGREGGHRQRRADHPEGQRHGLGTG